MPVIERFIPPERRKFITQMHEKSTQKLCQTSNCYAADSPARHFQQLASASDLKIPEALSSLKLPDWLRQDDLRIFCLRMSSDCFRMTKAGRLLPSSVRFQTWGTVSNGWCLTAKTSAYPSQDDGCILSAILIEDAPEKYYLSPAQIEKLLFKSSTAPKAPESMMQTTSPAP